MASPIHIIQTNGYRWRLLNKDRSSPTDESGTWAFRWMVCFDSWYLYYHHLKTHSKWKDETDPDYILKEEIRKAQ